MTTDVDEKLDAFSRALAFRTLSLTDFAPECVYHYTTAGGFAGILEQKAIRATNFSFLNDPTEVKYGKNVVESEIATLSRGVSPFFQKFLGDLSRHPTIKTPAEVYVTSFSALDDDLSQWRAYGTSSLERYAIGFDAPTLINQVTGMSNAMYAKVLYKPHDQTARVSSLLRKAIELIQSDSPVRIDIQVYAAVTAMHLVRLMPILKDPAFAREEEWRVIMWHRKEDVPPSIDASRGILRPYLLFGFGETLPVVDVNIMAPTRQDAALKATKILLQANGLATVEARRSAIPFADQAWRAD
jgi:hypothetical protein